MPGFRVTEVLARPWQARLPFFYGWVIVGVALILGFTFSAQSWAIGVFVIPMEQDLGWSRSMIYGALTLRGLIGAFLAPLIGGYLDHRHGARVISLIGAALCSVSLILTAWVTAEWQFILLYGVFGGIATIGGGLLIIQAIVPKWFLRTRGTVMSYATLGSALAAFAIPPIINVAIESFGWRGAWILLGALTLVLGGLPALVLRRQPEDVGLFPDGDTVAHSHQPGVKPRVQDQNYTLSQAVKSRNMWILVFAIAVGSLSIGGLPSNLIPLYVERGFTRDVAVLAFSSYGVFSIAARFLWGPVGDRYHVRSVLLGIALYCAVVTPLAIFLTGPAMLGYAGLVGFGIGGYVAFNQLVWATYFGRRHLGAIGGLARPFSAVANAIGPFMLAFMYDWSQSYTPGLIVVFISWILCALALVAAKPRPEPTSSS